MSRIMMFPQAGAQLRQREPKQEDEAHLDFIRELPCVICLREHETQACHIRMNDARYLKRTGGSEKPDDCWSIPMCSEHHRIQTTAGEGARFWEETGFDPHAFALMLHKVSPDPHRGRQVVLNWNRWLR